MTTELVSITHTNEGIRFTWPDSTSTVFSNSVWLAEAYASAMRSRVHARNELLEEVPAVIVEIEETYKANSIPLETTTKLRNILKLVVASLGVLLLTISAAKASDKPTKAWLEADAREKLSNAQSLPIIKPDPHRTLPYVVRNPSPEIAMRQFDKDGYHCDWYRVNGRGMVYSPDGAFLRHIRGRCKPCKGGSGLITSDTPARQPYVSPSPACANGRCR